MTSESTHEYTARLLPGGIDLALRARGAERVTLDASRIPHVQAEITAAVADPMLLAQLDPRDSRRIVVEAKRTDPSNPTPQVRVFDLGIRTATPDRAGGTVRLDLASDEAILTDHAQLADDGTPRTFQSSLRAVCEYVLSKVPGVARNLEPNSRALSTGSTAPYGSRFGWVRAWVANGAENVLPFGTLARFTSPETGSVGGRGVDSYGNMDLPNPTTTGDFVAGPTVTPGETITVSRYVRMNVATPGYIVGVRFHNGAGAWVGGTSFGSYTGAGSGTAWVRVSWTGVVPPGARRFSVTTRVSTVNVTPTTFLDITGVMTEATYRVRSWRDRALEPGGPDADVTAFWSITNLITNPSIEVNADGWTAGTNASAATRVAVTFDPPSGWGLRWTSGAAGTSYIDYAGASGIRVTGGRWYVLSGHMISSAASSGHARVHFKNQQGVTIAQAFGTTVPVSGSAWTRPYVIAQAPAGATSASVHFGFLATAAGQMPYVDAAMFYEGNEVVPYFDGATPDTAAYDYAWSDVSHGSNSTRTPSVERPPEALVWRAGVSGMSFLEPLLKASGLRLVCDELRRWSLRDKDYRADGNQMYRHGVNIETADESLSRDDDAWFDAAVYEYAWDDLDGNAQRRVDGFALTNTPTKVLRVEVPDTPFPGPGRAEHIVRRAQSRGRTVTVSAIPTWTEQTDEPLSVLLEGTPIQTGIAGSVRYDLGADTVTVTSRTADTPAAAWILIPVGERWTDSPAGGTWKNEVI